MDTLVGILLKGMSHDDQVFTLPSPIVKLREVHSQLVRWEHPLGRRSQQKQLNYRWQPCVAQTGLHINT